MSFIGIEKEDVYIDVNSQEEADEVITILERAGEPNDFGRFPWEREESQSLVFDTADGDWWFSDEFVSTKTVAISIPQLSKALGVEYPLKPKFEKGKWYIREDKAIFRFSGELDSAGDPRGYGVSVSPWWIGDTSFGWVGDFREATSSEVKEALLACAKDKGYKDGVWIKPLVEEGWEGPIAHHCTLDGTFSLGTFKDTYYLADSDGNIIFRDGVWAEIIDQEVPETECALEDKSLRQLLNEVNLEEVPVTFPCWVEGQVTLTAYRAPHSSTLYTTAKEARQAYIIHVIQDLL